MSKAKLKKYLQSLPQDHLVQVILDLYDARKVAKEYLEFFMNPDPQAALEKGKKDIYRNYFTPQGRPKAKMSIKAGNEIVADFIRLDIPPEQVADLMTYHLEVVLSRLVVKHIVRETAWISAINLFRKMVEYIKAHSLEHAMERRLEKIIEYVRYAPAYLNVEDNLKDILTETNYYDYQQ